MEKWSAHDGFRNAQTGSLMSATERKTKETNPKVASVLSRSQLEGLLQPKKLAGTESVGMTLWKQLFEQRPEHTSVVARLIEDKAILFLPIIPKPSSESEVNLLQHVYYGTIPREPPSVFFGELVYGPVELIGEGGAKAAIIKYKFDCGFMLRSNSDYVTFTPAPLPPNPDDPVQNEDSAPAKRNVQVSHPVFRVHFPDEDFNQLIPVCLLKRSPHASERAASVYSAGSALSAGPPRRSSSLPRISEKERIALALAKQRQMESEYQALVGSSPSPVMSQSTTPASPAPREGSPRASRVMQPKPRPGSLMLEEVFRGRKMANQDNSSEVRNTSSPVRSSGKRLTAGLYQHPENSASTAAIRRGQPGTKREYTPTATSPPAADEQSSSDDESSRDDRSDASSRKGLSDIEAEMARKAQEQETSKSPKTMQRELAADAAWRDLIKYLRSFITEFDKSVRAGTGSGSTTDGTALVRPADECGEEFQMFLQLVRGQLESMNRLPSAMGLEETMDWVENYLCQHLFPMYTVRCKYFADATLEYSPRQ